MEAPLLSGIYEGAFLVKLIFQEINMNKYKKHHQEMKNAGFEHNHHAGLKQGRQGRAERPSPRGEHGEKEEGLGSEQRVDPQQDSGTCPLCNRHCSLSDPGCPKGGAYLLCLNEDRGNPDLGEPEGSVAQGQNLDSLFKQTTRIMSRYNHRHDQPHHAQRHVYRMIKEKGPLAQKELMDMLGIRSASLSEVLAKLERRGHINRQRNQEDRRGFIVAVNEEMAMAEDSDIPGKEDMFSCLSAEETEQLATLLKKIISSADLGLGAGPDPSRKPGRAGGLGRSERSGRGGGKHRSGSMRRHPGKM
jgi:DNA-binding MarR family transcriptional regulator